MNVYLFLDELWNVMRNVNKQYYPMTRYWLGPIPFIAVYHPDDLEVETISFFHKRLTSIITISCIWFNIKTFFNINMPGNFI